MSWWLEAVCCLMNIAFNQLRQPAALCRSCYDEIVFSLFCLQLLIKWFLWVRHTIFFCLQFLSLSVPEKTFTNLLCPIILNAPPEYSHIYVLISTRSFSWSSYDLYPPDSLCQLQGCSIAVFTCCIYVSHFASFAYILNTSPGTRMCLLASLQNATSAAKLTLIGFKPLLSII